ncbi:hypothetical protein IGI37_002723 [Enterococcus sp. AZ194]|uniref:hypothetical protein n=1 Tax=Enterococcus sp. AZ194 TaxID=2774629 RepID=UPI003F2573C6
MKKMMQIELSRALLNKKMLAALLIGLFICLSQIPMYLKVGNTLDLYSLTGKNFMTAPDYLWGAWIGGDSMLVHGFLFFLILPLLAALPFGSSYRSDERDGYVKAIFVRTKRKNYYVAKWVATFISGGLAVILPLISNFLVMLTIFPATKPFPESSHFGVLGNSTLSGMFYSHPFVYLSIFWQFIFIFSGIYATLCLLVTFVSDYSFIILTLPFLCLVFITMLLDLFDCSYLSPQKFLYPDQAKISILWLLIEMAVLGISSGATYLLIGIKGELHS